MRGAVIYSGQYGSTAQYARWIGDDTGLPVFSVDDAAADPSRYDLLLLGSSILFFRARIRRWVRDHWSELRGKPLLLFTVSGAPAGPKLDGWVANSFPKDVRSQLEHVALRGRLDHADVSWWLRVLLKIGSLANPDPQAKQEERHGFDYMDRASVEPILEWVERQRVGGESTG